eukprot:scaffold3549_cov128-Isochrysis_galbana.AAC.1
MKNGERETVELGHVVVNPLLPSLILDNNRHEGPAEANASRTGSARRGSRGTARGRPSLCTSVTVIGLNLAAPN